MRGQTVCPLPVLFQAVRVLPNSFHVKFTRSCLFVPASFELDLMLAPRNDAFHVGTQKGHSRS